jgi:hypothetical protein
MPVRVASSLMLLMDRDKTKSDLALLFVTDYFICPGCRVVSPLNDNDKNNNKRMAHGPVRGGGVGLGFTFEELSKWQREMTRTGSRAMPPAGSSYRR